VCLKFALSAESLLVQKLLLAELHAKIKIQVRQNDKDKAVSTEHKRGKQRTKNF
jgi:hypothetical protein